MNLKGFSLIELVVVIAIIGVLTTIGTFQFAAYTRKSSIEKQTRKLYSDLMDMRSKALFEKKVRGMKIANSTYTLYSSQSFLGSPVGIDTLNYPITWDNGTDYIFNTDGTLLNNNNSSICVSESNSAAVDSIIISETRIRLGKLKEGASCASGNIYAK